MDGGLFDRRHADAQLLDCWGGDDDEAGVAECAVACGEVGFLLEHVVVLPGLGGVLYLSDLALCA